MKYIKRLYDWVLSWAETPYGAVALAVLAFAESSFFPIPPDVLLIALCLGMRTKAYRFALICTAGSVLGGIAGYLIGWGMWSAVDTLFFTYVPGFSEAKFEKVQGLYQDWDVWIVFIAAFTPIPYKVITITAGVFKLHLPMFIFATIIGRAARFYLVAFMIRKYGEPIREFIDKRFNILTVVFVILLVGGFYVLKLLGH